MPSRIKFIYITTHSKEEALELSDILINARLAACTNIFQEMTSTYLWEGKIKHQKECVLLVKTTAELVDEVIQKVRKMHSYELPCILCLDVEKGLPDYMNWIEKSVR